MKPGSKKLQIDGETIDSKTTRKPEFEYDRLEWEGPDSWVTESEHSERI